MDIHRVIGAIYCTHRIEGLYHCELRLLEDAKGKVSVATDPVGARSGEWVFTVSGSAGRLAMGRKEILTDLAIGGIIDHWEPPARPSGGQASAGTPEVPAEKKGESAST
jgi:carboxysome peptide B